MVYQKEVIKDKKKLQKNRMMNYFIEAAYHIIQKEGTQGVTIRKVSDLAGYNSATIYNYFDNLDHLIFMAAMHYLEDYNKALPSFIKECKNSLDIYMSVSYCFCIYSFSEPYIYNTLFFTFRGDKFKQYTNRFYEIYPEKSVETSPTIDAILQINDIYQRSLLMLNDCVIENIIKKEAVSDYNDICILIYQGILNRISLGLQKKENALEEIMRLYHQILKAYIFPEKLQLLLESEKKFNNLKSINAAFQSIKNNF